MAKARGRRRKGIHWDYNWDGAFATERYTTFDKRYWRRYWRREGQKEVENQTEGIRLDEEPTSKVGAVKHPLRVRVSHLPLDGDPEREYPTKKPNLEETNSVDLRPGDPEREYDL